LISAIWRDGDNRSHLARRGDFGEGALRCGKATPAMIDQQIRSAPLPHTR
jgi:hypothetical protein